MQGHYLFDEEEYEKSIEFFQKAWELSKDNRMLVQKGLAIKKIGNKEKSNEKKKEALEIFDEVIKNDVKNTVAWFEKGNCTWNLKNYKESEKCYLEACKLDPEDAEQWSCLGDLARMRGSPDEALLFYAKALFYDKTEINAHIGKARAYRNLKQYSE